MKTLELTEGAISIIADSLKEQRLFDIATGDKESAAKKQTLINYLESL